MVPETTLGTSPATLSGPAAGARILPPSPRGTCLRPFRSRCLSCTSLHPLRRLTMSVPVPLEVRTLPLADLKPAPYNPRQALKPADPRYRKLAASLREFG